MSNTSETTPSPEIATSYQVQFIGLACFLNEKDGKRVLLPDGSDPAKHPTPHIATISVASGSLAGAPNWPAADILDDHIQIQFRFPPSVIVVEGADQPGTLDATQQEPLLPKLPASAPGIQIDPKTAHAIGEIPIRQGILKAFLMPGTPANKNGALISQLEVQYAGNITITATPRNGAAGDVRSITLKPGTEIAFINASRGVDMGDESDHFNIYAELAVKPTTFALSKVFLKKIPPPSPSEHATFKAPHLIGSSVRCSNTGCCS